MNILPLQRDDLPMMKELQPSDWPDIFPILEFYLRKSFCYPLKLVERNKIIGIGTAYIHEDTVWLAHIIVHPGERDRGIGRMVTQALVDSVKDRYETIYLIATDLGEPVYNKIGFVTETEYSMLVKEGSHAGENTSINITPYEEKYKNTIHELDKKITGENRQVSLGDHLANALLHVEDNNVKGVYFPSWGEGAIIAQTAEAGTALMQERIKLHSKASMPVDNKAAIDFLFANGFKELKRVKRMRLGKKREWHPDKLYNRVAGKLG